MRWLTVLIALGLVGCGAAGTTTAVDTDVGPIATSQSSSITSTPPPSNSVDTNAADALITASDATTYFRQQVAAHYHGPVALGDGRGCLPAGRRYSCTAYVRNPSRDIDVVGTVTVANGNMTVDARLARGSEIQDWFAKTGGCKTNAC